MTPREEALDRVFAKRLKDCPPACEGCPGPNEETACSNCNAQLEFANYLKRMRDEILSTPDRDPIDDQDYVFEFLCDACKFLSSVSCGGSYDEPPDYEGFCDVVFSLNEDWGKPDCPAAICKGLFFIQDPKRPEPMKYEEYKGDKT